MDFKTGQLYYCALRIPPVPAGPESTGPLLPGWEVPSGLSHTVVTGRVHSISHLLRCFQLHQANALPTLNTSQAEAYKHPKATAPL